MPIALDPEHTRDGTLFDLPPNLDGDRQVMHAAGLVLGRFGLLLRGPSGSGKSFLQRRLRERAAGQGMHHALLSDDYVMLAALPTGALVAFAPVATRGLQEVHGVGIVPVAGPACVGRAVIHLLVDLVTPEGIERMPDSLAQETTLLGHPIAHLKVPCHASEQACDQIFATLSTCKDP